MSLLKNEFKFFFGMEPRQVDLWLINIFSLFMGIVLAFFVPIISEHTSLLQKIIIILLAWDDLGGIMANMTRSTNNYHLSNARVRLVFYSLHILQPFIIFLSFDLSVSVFLYTWLYPVLASILIVEFIKEDDKKLWSGILWVIGIITYMYVIQVPIYLMWFGITFFTKLILSYSVNHYPVQRSGKSDE
ncbi:hypothetical protein ACTWP4_04900 [Gracilibacillus sp. D59]|uniref:hypothetical protein n=1 Tax=Gracilibacillus sp. D59 TaxID=3457434 RepID=UPI003FCD9535